MSGQSNELVGPDLAAGVALETLTENVPLLGHAHNEAIVLVRNQGQIFAVAAHCSHYGGNLADGLVVDGQIRCPLHHACFSLRDGEVLRSPAQTPLTTYEVQQQGTQVRVGARRAAPPVHQSAEHPKHITIVGAGAAGYTAAETLRQRGYRGPLTLLGADSSAPYDRPNLSKDYLAGTAPEAWVALRPPEYYHQKGIDLRLGARVQSLDVAKQTLGLASGQSLHYETLLLATGSEPVRLSIPGAALPHVHTLRTLEQCRNIIHHAQRARRVVILGANFIGMEAAAALRGRNLDVQVVAPTHMPMQTTFGPQLGLYLQRLHEQNGVVFHMGQEATRIEAERVVLQDGTAIPADMVLLGVGARPALDVARSAGLRVEDGIVVNSYLQTSAPNVYAAGDNCAWPDSRTQVLMRVEHWVPAQRQGQTAARNMLGERVMFDAVPFFWTAQFGTTISYVGHARTWDKISEHGSLQAGKALLAYWQGGRVAAVASIGLNHTLLQCELAMERSAEDTLQRLLQALA